MGPCTRRRHLTNTIKRTGVTAAGEWSYLVFGLVDVEDVDDGAEVAHDVVVSAHVGGRDAADDVLAQPAHLLGTGVRLRGLGPY